MGKFRELVRPFYLQRRKEDVWNQLPPAVEEWRWVDPGHREQHFYEELLHHIAARREENRHAGGKYKGTLADFTRLRMAACHPTILDGAADLEDFLSARPRVLQYFREHPATAKVQEVTAIVREMIAQAKGIIFATNVGMVHLLQESLEGQFGDTCLAVTGAEREETRAGILREFRDNPGKRVLLATDALTYGVNLQVASYVVNYDLPLNPAKVAQRRGRIERIGQNSAKLSVVHLVARGTIEMHVADILRAKRNLIQAALESNDPTDLQELEDSILAELEVAVFYQGMPKTRRKRHSLPTAKPPVPDFNAYFRQVIPEQFRTKTCVLALEFIDIKEENFPQGLIQASIHEDGDSSEIYIDVEKKVVAHSCAFFTPDLQQKKEFCPHLGALFRKLRKVDELNATLVLSSLVAERDAWTFKGSGSGD
jgi:hypothetical protein